MAAEAQAWGGLQRSGEAPTVGRPDSALLCTPCKAPRLWTSGPGCTLSLQEAWGPVTCVHESPLMETSELRNALFLGHLTG